MAEYLDIPVLEFEPDGGDDAQGAFVRALTLFDPTTGPRLVRDRGGVSLPSRASLKFILEGRAEIASWLAFCDSLAGKQGVFWLPSWIKDFQPSQAIVGGSNSIRVVNAGYTAHVFGDQGRSHLAIIQSGPTFDYRKIVTSFDGMGGGGEPTDVVVMPALPNATSAIEDQTYAVRVRGAGLLSQFTGGITVSLKAGAGDCDVAKVVILRTANGSTIVLDSTPVQFGNSDAFTIPSGTELTSDVVDLEVVDTFDYYILAYVNGATASFSYEFIADLSGEDVSVATPTGGDQTGISDINVFNWSPTIWRLIASWKSVGAVSDGDEEEILTVDGDPLTALEPDEFLLCFLTLCRLDTDDIAMLWTSRTRLEVTVSVVERPTEIPDGEGS